MEKCNHRISSKNSSILIFKENQNMVYPRKVYGVCEMCGKNFEYSMDEKGKLKIFKGEE